MKSIRAQIIIFFTITMSTLLAFGFLTYSARKNFELLNLAQDQSYQVVDSATHIQAGLLAATKKKWLEENKNLLQPEFRANAASQFLQSPSTSRFETLLKSESEFRRYNLPLLEYQKKKIGYFASITLGAAILFTLFTCVVALRLIFSPLHILAQQMNDFLNMKYSYKFAAPEDNEIGELRSTFNQLAQKVLTQIEDLKALDKAKSEFLSIASHELRTPLTSIKGSLSLLQGGAVGPVQDTAKKLMTIALSETDRLIRIINELLDLAKIEARQFPLKPDWLEAQDFITKTFQSLSGLCTSAQVQLRHHSDEKFDIYADSDRLQQVLTNLLSNAIKFSAAGSTVEVHFETDANNMLRVEVRDQGPGIAPEDQELIFEKFRQVTGPKNPLVKGTGLGLTIAKALVEQHGGTIGVQSRPGAGSTFFFTLPKWRLHSELNKVG